MYSRVGGGHLSAARAMVAELEATGQCTARPVDIYVDCGRFPVTRFPSIYARMARSHPRLWSLVYYGSGSSRRLKPNWVVGPFLNRGLTDLLHAERPDVVIGVLPAINEVLVESTRSVGARLEVVLTDWHDVHPFWCAPGVDHYTAPTHSARSDCLRFGAPPEAVDVVGIPVRREFAMSGTASRAEHLSAIGLDPARFTILAMVGAEGSPHAMANLAALARSDLDAQLVVVCGRSRSLRPRIEPCRPACRCAPSALSRPLAELMRSLRPARHQGGWPDTGRSVLLRMPVVVHDVLPGQEAGNLEYVLQHGAVGVRARRRRAWTRTIVALAARSRSTSAVGGVRGAAGPSTSRARDRGEHPRRGWLDGDSELRRARSLAATPKPSDTGPCGPSRTTVRVQTFRPRARSRARRFHAVLLQVLHQLRVFLGFFGNPLNGQSNRRAGPRRAGTRRVRACPGPGWGCRADRSSDCPGPAAGAPPCSASARARRRGLPRATRTTASSAGRSAGARPARGGARCSRRRCDPRAVNRISLRGAVLDQPVALHALQGGGHRWRR